MVQAVYVKAKPKILGQAKDTRRDRYFFALVSLIGLSAIIFAAWPILIWQITTLPRLTAGVNRLPIPKSEVLSAKSTLESNVQVVKDPDGFSYFVPTNLVIEEKDRPTEFYLSIPKLKIFKAKVKVDNLNFYISLSHFPNSALPGEVGNSFITGHSVLPQFYDPTNYLTIFSKLSDLEIGDDVIAELGGNKFQYTVGYSKIVDPHDLSVLSKISPNGRNLTLMTCVPPGANTKRLVVVTSLL
ncbi:hypothetical protein A3D81_02390 [Candidatus Curtissbacteria bacterium RIFCSPHIGHO2_02_FULL_40_17]|uniref:Sortase n=2 Tax=Candidatus Curtissiibacteriota TaxID=1752717 RepID=A0A1F5GJC0_9BACT|nr:MAG: hypothetical protein A3D81_02390 [Candidatus Curtissbacteria bacterium RIFCSPHIGHO2_02_FULL_40_17]OGE07693.1 MAG: hypothetical protein A3I53_02635 [Candidatus Curtissbacteria bacterium RIFCSPLOWO2_02_FULL_40_13b]